MTDLTDRFNEICDDMSTPSLEEQWDENPEPEVGAPSGRTILEEAGGTTYIWNTHDYNRIIRYTGETMDVVE